MKQVRVQLGFTLIETTVVSALIGILALLLGVFLVDGIKEYRLNEARLVRQESVKQAMETLVATLTEASEVRVSNQIHPANTWTTSQSPPRLVLAVPATNSLNNIIFQDSPTNNTPYLNEVIIYIASDGSLTQLTLRNPDASGNSACGGAVSCESKLIKSNASFIFSLIDSNGAATTSPGSAKSVTVTVEDSGVQYNQSVTQSLVTSAQLRNKSVGVTKLFEDTFTDTVAGNPLGNTHLPTIGTSWTRLWGGDSSGNLDSNQLIWVKYNAACAGGSTGSSRGVIYRANPISSSADYSVQIKITKPPTNNKAYLYLLARVGGAEDFYALRWRSNGNGNPGFLELFRKQTGIWSATPLGSHTFTVDQNNQYQIKLEVTGNRLKAFLDDMITAKFEATDSSLASGSAGLAAGGGAKLQPITNNDLSLWKENNNMCRLDDFKVEQ